MLAALAAPLPLIQVQAPQGPSWLNELQDKGWTFLGATADNKTAIYARKGLETQTGGNPKLWVRFEFRDKSPNETVMSVSDYDEIDCTNATLRILSESAYTARNLLGQGQINSVASGWIPAAPGTILEQVFNRACVNKLPPPRP